MEWMVAHPAQHTWASVHTSSKDWEETWQLHCLSYFLLVKVYPRGTLLFCSSRLNHLGSYIPSPRTCTSSETGRVRRSRAWVSGTIPLHRVKGSAVNEVEKCRQGPRIQNLIKCIARVSKTWIWGVAVLQRVKNSNQAKQTNKQKYSLV